MSSIRELVDEFKELAYAIYYIVRGSKGIQPEAEHYVNLMNTSDRKETTRVTEHQIYEHTYMRLGAKVYPYELELFEYVADTEDAYFVSLNGEQRREAILMTKARTQPTSAETLQIITPNTQEPLTQEPRKKHFWQHGDKKNEPNA